MADRKAILAEDAEAMRIERALDEAEGPDDRARAYLSLGLLGEKREDWNAAVGSYAKALAAGSLRADFNYFGNNNLGFSLIQLGRFDEAEDYCIAAMRIDPSRHNAHKNLGLVRQAQGRWPDAAHCFVEAHRLCPIDPRAWHLLSALLQRHPALLAQSAELRSRVAAIATSDGAATSN
jgi:tetratricopeptide (TPR) repeat protein